MTLLFTPQGRLFFLEDVSGTMKPSNGLDFVFVAAILKGVIEHGDGLAYLDSLVNYAEHKAQAIELGWVEAVNNHLIPTDKGRKVYNESQLGKFTKTKLSRAHSWDWSKTNFNIE